MSRTRIRTDSGLTAGARRCYTSGMDPQLLDLICEGIAIGVCPIADDDDLRLLLAALERLVDAPDPRAVVLERRRPRRRAGDRPVESAVGDPRLP